MKKLSKRVLITTGVGLLVFCLLNVAAHAQTCVQPPSGAIAWWPLDETSGTIALDVVGNKPGAHFDGPIHVAGKVRGALQFDGVNDFVGVGDSDLWAFGNRDFTIELWAYFNSPGGGTIGHPSHIFIGNDEGPGTRNKWFFALGGGFLNFHINGPLVGSHFFPLAPFSPAINQWYHLAVTRNGNTWTLYIDGTAAASAINPVVVPNASAPLTIGQAEDLGFMNGRLDEVTIYNRALTQAELQSIVDAGTAGKCKPLPAVTEFVSPSRGGDTGSVTVRITGNGFMEGASAKLRRAGNADIGGNPVTLSEDGAALTTTFNLTGKARGLWDVVVANPDGTSVILPKAFTIEAGRAAQVWVDVVGRGAIRTGREQAFTFLYGNRGNINGVMVPFWISGIPIGSTVRLGFEIGRPDSSSIVDYSSVPVLLETSDEIVLPLLIPHIATGMVGALTLHVVVPPGINQFNLRVAAGTPLLQSPLSEKALSCLKTVILAAIPKIIEEAAGPILDCMLSLFDLTLQKLARELSPNSPPISMFWQFVDIVVNCGQLFLPAAKLPELIGAGIDIAKQLLTLRGILEDCVASWRDDTSESSPIIVVGSYDPNDKLGSRGAGSQQFLGGDEPLRYAVFFENVETATAPAQEVVITDQLDMSKIDLNTLSLGPISFGNKQIIPPPGLTEYTTTVDLRPAKQLLVNVEGRLNKTTGLLTWRFTSIDPVTGELPDDPLAGFLPPNKVPPEGDGSVLFTVMPKKGLATGTEIRNQAQIIFDTNAPIDTPQWLNTLDNTKPTSNVLPLPSTQSSASFNVQWQGTDVGSGVKNFTIFVSENGGPSTPWLNNTSATSGTFTGQSGETYGFYSVAQDQTGNREDPPNEADATTQVVTGTDLAITQTAAPNPVLTGANFTYTLTVTNNGSGAVADVTVTDSLPAATTFVSCSSTGGGVCGGSGNNRTVTFTSLAAGASATITLVANVNCSVADNTAISNTATVSSSTPDPVTDNNSAMVMTTASNPPPVITDASANPSELWSPNHQMVEVTLNYNVTDNCGPVTCTPSVSSNEPIKGTGDGDTAPDWEIVDAHRVRLRAERAGKGTGRNYTITITCRDSAGNSSSRSVTVRVPISQGKTKF